MSVETTVDVLRPVFKDHIISHLATAELGFDNLGLLFVGGMPSKISVTPTSQRQLTL